MRDAIYSAVPVVFNPVAVGNYPGCGFELPDWLMAARVLRRRYQPKTGLSNPVLSSPISTVFRIPTSFRLRNEQVDLQIEAKGELLRTHPEYQRLLADLGKGVIDRRITRPHAEEEVTHV